jgi:UDP-N-acetylmuramoyl-L-alanyl-D-glutamate--2,6-diaminopimelate ligase
MSDSHLTLQSLFSEAQRALVAGDAKRKISGLAYHSSRVEPGFAFFSIRGFKDDGSRYISDAVARGAVAIVSEAPFGSTPVPHQVAWVQVRSIRAALAQVACEFYRHPSRELALVGVTGTNGKTTTAFLIASILEAAGRTPALAGTIENRLRFSDPASTVPVMQTTPESLDLQRWLRDVRTLGGEAAVMEVSSHSLALDRVTGSSFHTAVWTNFARDHLDFHHTLDEYFAAKKKLILPIPEGLAPRFTVLNADDARYAQMRERVEARAISFGIEQPGDVTPKKWKTTAEGIELTAHSPAGSLEVRSRLVGRHNVANILAAIAAATSLQVEAAAIQAGLREITVPGRLEPVSEGQPFTVLVDYAHTDDALCAVVAATREITRSGSLIVVFGCGGDRDRTKRPAMGQAAAAADRVILTSDNPRSEDPLQIINDVQVGLQKAGASYVIEPDRAAAIRRALREARSGDTVLIAGKGHENYQIIGTQRLAFDDREAARAALRELREHGKIS